MNSPLTIGRDVDLTDLNTLRVRCRADSLVELSDPGQLDAALNWFDQFPNPVILGGGSNVLLTQDQLEAVLVIALPGRRILSETAGLVKIELGAGENWHDAVRWTLDNQCYGLENLSLIPGRVGAAPVQNIGAYGVELADFVDTVHAIRLSDQTRHQLTRQQCEFAYRDSLFKRANGQWLITGVTLTLNRKPSAMLDYGEIRNELKALQIVDPTPVQISETICQIRRRKLPDPVVLPNAGSFFKNPVVTNAQADKLSKRFPAMPRYEAPESGSAKLAAGWLIESAGFKGVREHDAGTHTQHALVLVNHGRASGAQLRALAEKIQTAVSEKFSVQLVPEPVFIPSA